MTALDRKCLRDLRRMGSQALAIALVMACGVATFSMSLSTMYSLDATLAGYYSETRFADVFASLKRAPRALVAQIAEIPGVADVETRTVAAARLDVPGLAEPASARLISLPDRREPRLNRLHLRRGRWLEPGRTGETLVGEPFAEAHHLSPGDHVDAVIEGRRERLTIVGIVLSPEYVFQMQPGDMMPDHRRFGIFWMSEAELGPAYGLDGAFNDVALRLDRGASEADVVEHLDQLLEPYGGLGAHGRADQVSHQFVSNELQQLRTMTVIMPSIFLAVAAFLLNIVMSRLIATQREEIATLKAFGYSRREIGVHYLKLVGGIVVVGLVLGSAFGMWLGGAMTRLYQQFFRFPTFGYRMDPEVIGIAAFVAGGAALAGTWAAVARAVRLAPAEAMRPEPPAAFRRTIVERLGLERFFSHSARMILRELERQPVRAAMSTIGLALAVSILVVGNFMQDGVQVVIENEFFRAQRQDMTLTFAEPTSGEAWNDVRQLPGVLAADPFRSVPSRLRHGHVERRVGILGLSESSEQRRVLDDKRGVLRLPPEGLAISRFLADALGVSIGDVVTVEILEGERPIRRVPISDLVEDFAGVAAYMRLDALHRMMREGGSLSGAYLRVDPLQAGALFAVAKQDPRIGAISVKRSTVQAFRDTLEENLEIARFFNMAFATVIAFGVVYNAARISLAERSHELGTLRVMGFTELEISKILLGELAVLVLAAIPVGLVLGYVLASMLSATMATETQRFPFVVERATFGAAAAVVLVAALVSALSVRRRLARLDLIAVLKARD